VTATLPLNDESHYLGTELEVFQHATCWKQYFGRQVRHYLRGDVLEVGAGLGSTARALCDGQQRSWTLIEPDAELRHQLIDSLRARPLPVPADVRSGTTEQLDSELFDAILYIDVIEHIEDDRAELARAARHLRPGGALIILVPAHQWLFTPFDAAIGHFRRYDRVRLKSVIPAGLKPQTLRDLDSVGLLASLANRLLLHSAAPTHSQVMFWDRVLVRMSRVLDPVVCYRLGKSLLGVWTCPEATDA